MPELPEVEVIRRGLAPVLVEAIFETIEYVNKQEGTTILLVEQNAQMALSVASRAMCSRRARSF